MAIIEKQRIFEAIEKSANPLIVIPQNPEGDVAGGSLALFLALRKTGKHPRIVCSGDLPENFSFLLDGVKIEKEIEKERIYRLSLSAGENKIKDVSYEQHSGIFNIYFSTETGSVDSDSLKIYSRLKYDLVLTLAVHNLESLGEIYFKNKEIFSSLEIVNIDNSEINSQFGNINVIDGYAPSISEITAEIIRNVLLFEYDKETATAILAGIISKTDNFQVLSVAPETFSLAGALMAAGAQRMEIIKRFYGVDFGGGSSGRRNPQPEIFGAGSDVPAAKNEISGTEEGIKSSAAPASLAAANFPTGKLGILGPLKKFSRTFGQPDILKSKTGNSVSVFKSLLLFFRQLFFGIFLGFALIVMVFGKGNISGVFPNMDSFRIKTKALAGNVKEKIIQVSSGMILPQKTIYGIKTANSEIMYSASKAKDKNIGLPLKLNIPRLGLEARILEVGLDASGTMETPDNYMDAGWFNLGVRPGEIGKAVITGHLNTADSANGIFRRLSELGAGDDVFVADSENNKLHFRVVASKTYDAKNAPMGEIFGGSEEARLNLITCDGVWDKKALSYAKRLVVFTKLAEEI